MKIDKYTAILGNVAGYHDMSTLAEKRPLANLSFDGKYRSIDFQLSNPASAGIRSIYAIFHGQNIRSVFDHVKSGREWGLNTLLSYYFLGFYNSSSDSESVDKDYYEQALAYLKHFGSDQTVYMNCDILCNIDLEQVIHLHDANNDGPITVVHKKMPRESISEADEVLEIDEIDYVVGRADVNDSLDLQKMSADIYVIDTPWLVAKTEGEAQKDQPRKLRYLLRELIVSNNALASEYTGYLSNICSVKSYYDASVGMLSTQKLYSLLYPNQKVYTKVKNEKTTYFVEKSDIKSSQFASGSIIKGDVEYLIASRNCYAVSGSRAIGSIPFPKVTIGEGIVIENATVDKNVVIAPGVIIRSSKENPIVTKKGLEVTEDVIQ